MAAPTVNVTVYLPASAPSEACYETMSKLTTLREYFIYAYNINLDFVIREVPDDGMIPILVEGKSYFDFLTKPKKVIAKVDIDGIVSVSVEVSKIPKVVKETLEGLIGGENFLPTPVEAAT